jgi:hypothetical protein
MGSCHVHVHQPQAIELAPCQSCVRPCSHTRVMPCTRCLQSSAAASSKAAAHQVRTVSSSSNIISSHHHKLPSGHTLQCSAQMAAVLSAALLASMCVSSVAVIPASAVTVCHQQVCFVSIFVWSGRGLTVSSALQCTPGTAEIAEHHRFGPFSTHQQCAYDVYACRWPSPLCGVVLLPCGAVSSSAALDVCGE